MKLVRVQPYHFQVRNPSFSCRFEVIRFRYYSCKLKLACFWDFEACRKLGEVLRKLGVLRLKELDVGIIVVKVGRSFRGFFRRIHGELGVEEGIDAFVSSIPSF